MNNSKTDIFSTFPSTPHKLVISEKPSVARSIAAVLGATENHDGYLSGNGYIISWCVGHLVSAVEPEAYDEALREGLRVFDRLSERYGLGDGFSAEIMKDELSAETADAIGDDGRDENGKAHKP